MGQENQSKLPDFGVAPAKQAALESKWMSLGLTWVDVSETTSRSSGKGGQNANKLATRVQLKHLPTGVMVQCQKTRYQRLNRYYACHLLAEKIENQKLGKQSSANQKIEKMRRQKQKRRKRAKEKRSSV